MVKTQKKFPNVGIIFLLYWVVLIIWQNINPNSVGGTADTLIKTILLLILVLYSIIYARANWQPFVILLIFTMNMLISFSFDGVFSLRSLLNYFYPVVLFFLTFIVGGKHELKKSQLVFFLNGVVVVVLYTVIYSVLFLRKEILAAITATNAYGSEFSAFFISNHEYALYLMAGIISCILLLELNQSKRLMLKLYYSVCVSLFFLCLLITFSRTYLFVTLAIIFVYVVLHRKSKISKLIIGLAIVAGIIVLSVPSLKQYVFEIILKENTDSGRAALRTLAWNTYKEGSLAQKLWGSGASNVQNYFDAQTSHHSVHNAYLQVLLYYGAIGIFFLLLLVAVHWMSVVRSMKHNPSLGAIFVALPIGALLAMVVQTVTIFTSFLDSYFLTIFAFVIPKYVCNAIRASSFED